MPENTGMPEIVAPLPIGNPHIFRINERVLRKLCGGNIKSNDFTSVHPDHVFSNPISLLTILKIFLTTISRI
jgi:hypothetical protein